MRPAHPRARHLDADRPYEGDWMVWDGDQWRRPARQHLGDRALIAFGILVLLYFAGELARAWWH